MCLIRTNVTFLQMSELIINIYFFLLLFILSVIFFFCFLTYTYFMLFIFQSTSAVARGKNCIGDSVKVASWELAMFNWIFSRLSLKITTFYFQFHKKKWKIYKIKPHANFYFIEYIKICDINLLWIFFINKNCLNL